MTVLSTGDRIGFALVGGLIAWFLLAAGDGRRDGSTTTGSPSGTSCSRGGWSGRRSCRCGSGPGRPWVQLDLSDGDTLAVMGIQRADGAFADAEARRLATLVAMHTATPRDD